VQLADEVEGQFLTVTSGIGEELERIEL